MADDGGPTKITPFFSHYCANDAFSDKNPKPGCRASQFDYRAISNILLELR